MRRTLLVLPSLLLATSASAHPEWSPVQVNRYCKLVLGEKSRIVYTVLFGDGPALPERKAVDANADGKLDAHERELLGARIGKLVSEGFHIELDGKPFVLPKPKPDVGLAGDGVAPDPFSVDLTYALSFTPGPHEIWIDDRVVVTNEGDSEIAVEASPPAQLTSAHRGRTGTGVEKVFTFRGPRFSLLEDRSVGLRFSTSAASIAARVEKRSWKWIVGVIAIVAALAAWAARRRATAS